MIASRAIRVTLLIAVAAIVRVVFFTGLTLILIFAINLKWFPIVYS